MKKTPKKLSSFIDKFNEREAKGSVENTALKGLIDVVSGGIVGPGIAATTGKYSPLAGLILILAGHYFGDKSGVLRTTGASSLAFGIAKSNAYRNDPTLNSPKKRLKGLGNDLLTTLHGNWKKEQNKMDNSKNKRTMKNEEQTSEIKTNEVTNKTKDEFEKEQANQNIPQFDLEENLKDMSLEGKTESSESIEEQTSTFEEHKNDLDIDEDNVAQYLF